MAGILAAIVVALAMPSGALAAQQVISSAGPLTNIYLNDDLRCNASYAGDLAPEFYGSTEFGSCGTFLSVSDASLGFTIYGFRYVQYTLVSQTAPEGSGTSADPYRVTTVVDVGTTGLRISQTDSYVVGQEAYITRITVFNTSSVDTTATLYHAADCFLQDSDVGYGYFDPSTGGIYCTRTPNNAPVARIEGFVPLDGGSHFIEGYFDTVFLEVDGTDFPDTCDCDVSQDNGAGLSWTITVPAGGSVTRSLATTFSPGGIVPSATPAETTVTGGPSGPINDATPTFTFSSSEAGSSFECRVDGGTFAGCASPHTTASLGDGGHSFEVRAVGLSGADTTPAARAFTVDTTAPGPADLTGPVNVAAGGSPSFTFGSGDPDVIFECRLDGAPFAPCSSPFRPGPVPEGEHALEVRARDGAGNLGPASRHPFTVLAEVAAGRTANISAVSGKVRFRRPGEGRFIDCTTVCQIPVGSIVDARKGTVRLVSASDLGDGTQVGRFQSGSFKLLQKRVKRPVTELRLQGGDFSRCSRRARRGRRAAAGSAGARAVAAKARRKLTGNAKGSFRTRGRNGAATVRGTRWSTEDRCAGTRFRALQGSIKVRDFTNRRTLVLRAGKSYLAPARGRSKR